MLIGRLLAVCSKYRFMISADLQTKSPYSKFQFGVDLHRTKRRKSISIQVRGGGVRVLAPHRVPSEEIEALLHAKLTWIERKLREQEVIRERAPRSYVDGARWPFLGGEIVLAIGHGRAVDPTLQGNCLTVSIPSRGKHAPHEAAVRHQLEMWLREQARIRLVDFTQKHSKRIGRSPKSIMLKTYKARWGSCSASGNITYDWRLVMAPLSVINYVAAHEVAHLQHLDHSKKFWSCVDELCPDNRKAKTWLRRYGATLNM